MKFDPQHQHRHSIRLPACDYSAPGAYFITIVTQWRIRLFGEVIEGRMQLSDRGLIAEACWRAIPEHFRHAQMGAFVVMPNHIHGIIILHERNDRASADASARRGTIYRAPTTAYNALTAIHANTENLEKFQKPAVGSVPTIIRTYKAAVTRRIVEQFGGVPHIWQRNYYEHIIRNDAEHSRIHLYIESNAVNWPTDDENPMSYPLPSLR